MSDYLLFLEGGRLSNHLSAGSRLKTSASGQNDERFQPARTEEEWLQLDEKVNEYPCHRTFKAIGTGGKVNRSLIKMICPKKA